MLGYGPVASYPICGPDTLETPAPVVIAPTGGAGVSTRVRARAQPQPPIVRGSLDVEAAPAWVTAIGSSQGQIRGVLAVVAASPTVDGRGRSEDEEGWFLGETNSVLASDEAEALWLLGWDE